MKGAIDIIKGWREICEDKTDRGYYANERKCYRHCANCKLEKQCKKAPAEWTDEDILDLVNKIGGTK